ncbi:unnamed protein product [Medioppia subpectinata]|uniref:Uncharacterized protein n=1 Tax=Medioppia subpectinata TaxID=1979941 RepID=A0A7R9KNZ4_9ACAR|nr:unnamed protein product [Medioppia subpectinata]CAG2107101.1 unnamed protein product [Medioppia subpectinata]
MESLINWCDSKNKDKRSPNKPSIKNTETTYSEPQQKAVSKANAIQIKNDIPNQFWHFIEPYSCEITSEHIKGLEPFVISLKWDDNEIIDQKDKKKGLCASNSGGRSSIIHSNNKTKKGSKNQTDADKTSYGALTQRLVSCLIEENLLNGGLIDSKSMSNDNNNLKGASNGSPNHKVFKSLDLGNTTQLERRIRKELEEHRIISLDDILNGSDTSGGDDDEIVQELKRCQQELKSLSDKNQTQLKRLVSSAKKEMTRQEVSKKLETADSEVIEAYRRIVSAKQKKRSPTKKEKESASKAIKDREQILKQLLCIS